MFEDKLKEVSYLNLAIDFDLDNIIRGTQDPRSRRPGPLQRCPVYIRSGGAEVDMVTPSFHTSTFSNIVVIFS